MFDASVSTHVGLTRKINEDCFIANKQLGLWVVADGVGGSAHGEYASQLLTAIIEDSIRQGESLDDAIQCGHNAIKKTAKGHPELAGMATTVVACHFKGSHYDIAWVGDSRAYLFNNKGIYPVTRDHNRAQWLVEQGRITRNESWNHPAQSQLTHAIGIDESLYIDHVSGDIQSDEVLMLCTDGLSGELRDASMWEIYKHCVDSVGTGFLFLERLTETLVQAALNAGGNDNITLALIRYGEMMANQSGSDRRTHPRTQLNIKVSIQHEILPNAVFIVRDISDVGIFVVVDENPFPPLGSVVSVQALGLPVPAPVQKMVVVRKGKDGFGLQFTTQFNPE